LKILKYLICLVFILSLATIYTYLNPGNIHSSGVGNATVSIILLMAIAGIIFSFLFGHRRKEKRAVVFVGFVIGACIFVIQTFRTAIK